ncbi:hypothetical protein YC2023_017762 [Brassica napus]
MVIDASNSDQTKLQLREKTWFANPLNSRLMYICHAPSTPYNRISWPYKSDSD